MLTRVRVFLLLLALSSACKDSSGAPPGSAQPDGGRLDAGAADAGAADAGAADAGTSDAATRGDADAARAEDAQQGDDAQAKDASAVDPSLPAVTEGEGKIFFPTPRARTASDQTLVIGCVAAPATASGARLGARAVPLDARGCFRDKVETPLGRTIVELTVQRGAASAVAGRIELLHEFASTGAYATAFDPQGGRVFVVDSGVDGYEVLELALAQGVDRRMAVVPTMVQLAYDTQTKRLLVLSNERLLSVNIDTGEQTEKSLDLGSAMQDGDIAFDGTERVLYALRQTSIVAIEVDSGRVRTVHRGSDDESVLEGLAFYPASRELFTVRSGFDAKLLAFHADTGAQRTIGTSVSGGTSSLAVVGDRLYLNGADKLRALALPGGTPNGLSAAPSHYLETLVGVGSGLIATHGEGIERVDPATGAMQRLRGFAFPRLSLRLAPAAHIALDEPRGQLFVASGAEVRAFDLNTGEERGVIPSAAAVDRDTPPSFIDLHRASGQLYALLSNRAGRRLVRIDPNSKALTTVADLTTQLADKLPQALVAQGAYAYVAVARAPTVLKVELSSGRVETKTLELGTVPMITDLAADDRAARLFIVEASGDVAEHDYASFEAQARHTTNGSANDGSAAYEPATQTLWVLDNNNGTGFWPVRLAGGEKAPVRAAFGTLGDAPFAIYQGQFLVFDGVRLRLQDIRGEQTVELWRPR